MSRIQSEVFCSNMIKAYKAELKNLLIKHRRWMYINGEKVGNGNGGLGEKIKIDFLFEMRFLLTIRLFI